MRRIIADMSSILWTCLRAGIDEENGVAVFVEGKDKPQIVNSWMYGYDNVISSLNAALRDAGVPPRNLVMVFEGKSSKSLRLAIHPDYKGTRESKTPEMYEQFHRLCSEVERTFLDLGALSVTQSHVEGDDIVAYLAQNLDGERIVLSNDGDLAVLSDPGNHVHTRIGGEWDTNKCGNFPSKFITLYKALVGDTSDNIKGAYRFGDGSFKKVLETFGLDGLHALQNLVVTGQLHRLSEDVSECKELQRVLDDLHAVYTSWKLARLYPERVNTVSKPLVWKVGKPEVATENTPEVFRPWAAQHRIVNATNFDSVFAHLKKSIHTTDYIVLDIETSTPNESDDWDADSVDTVGTELTGLGLSWGSNLQFNGYFTVGHATDDNLSSDQIRQVLDLLSASGKPVTIHNVNFELPVLKRYVASEDYGDLGFLPNIDDTKLMASYVDENDFLGLKHLSKKWLGYEQTTYDELVTDKETGRRRKMRELTPEETLGYGLDDIVCTGAIRNYTQVVMELEKTFNVYREVEIDAAYLTAQALLDGVNVSRSELRKQAADNVKEFNSAWEVVKPYLCEIGWPGSFCPYLPVGDYKSLKTAYNLLYGEPLDTQMRTDTKIIRLIESLRPDAVEWLDLYAEGREGEFNEYVSSRYTPNPELNLGSPKQMQELLYTHMGLPIRLRNKATDTMREAGVYEGNAKTNELAIVTAMFYDLGGDPVKKKVLSAILQMKKCQTREQLYFATYPGFIHWKTGKIHASINQCATNTRRYSASKPNLQQLPKKGDARFRQVFRPHKRNALVVSLDFKAQELRVIADDSKDSVLCSCYVGDNLRDMHSLTATNMAQKDKKGLTYEEFEAIHQDKDHPDHKWASDLRKKAKVVNFSSEYGAQAEKMAETLMVPVEEAQQYLEAKWSAFSQVESWKDGVIAEAHRVGYVLSKMGARRHLAEQLQSRDRWEVAKAERRAVNYRIQGSSAEMTKMAMGRIWRSRVLRRYDARFIAPVHDELVFSVDIDQAFDFCKEVYSCMVAPYGGMWIPIESSISLGPDFGNQYELADPETGEQITRATFQAAIKHWQGMGLLQQPVCDTI